MIKKQGSDKLLRDSEISHEKWQILNYRIYYHSIFVTITKLASKLYVFLGISYFYPKTLLIFSVKILKTIKKVDKLHVPKGQLSSKGIFVFSILPINKRKFLLGQKSKILSSFFGRIEDNKISFRD